MIHPRDLLLNDRSLVQILRRKVRRRSDDLDTALVRLMVRLSSLERRQEGVVDVDDAARHRGAEDGREDLHVPREYDELDVVRGAEIEDLLLLRGLGVLGHGEVVEGDAVALGQVGELRVVGYNERDLNAQLSDLHPVEQVVETVSDLGDHKQHTGLLAGGLDLVVHLVLLGQGREGLGQVLRGGGLGFVLEMHPHEELVGGRVGELLQVCDVVVRGGQNTCDTVNDAGRVGAGQSEDVAGLHGGGCVSC